MYIDKTCCVRLVNQAPFEREKPIRKFFIWMFSLSEKPIHVHFTDAACKLFDVLQ